MTVSYMAEGIKHPQWQLWSGELSAETCDRWLEICRRRTPIPAKTFRTGDSDDEDNLGTRKTQIRWIYDDADSKEIFTTLQYYLTEANKVMPTDIDHLPPIQFTEYADVGHHYSNHHDVDWNRQDGKHRKLSITVQLSDPSEYAGGIFQFAHTENPAPEAVGARGSILVFYPYLEHLVTPILNGSRSSLVAWVEGPRWH